MIRSQHMHGRDNAEISPEERHTLATMIKMSKMLKIERGVHEYYPPQRIVLHNYGFPALDGAGLDHTISIPVKFVQLMHSTKTMVQVEYASLTDAESTPFAYSISLPDIPSVRDWVVNDNLLLGQPGSVIWSGDSLNHYQHAVNSNEIGFPISDPQFLNNSNVNIRLVSPYAPMGKYRFYVTLVFYTYSGGE